MKRRRFYLVAEEIMPDAMIKTVQAKDMLTRGDFETVNDAVQALDLSRSAFYKYRDLVFTYNDEAKDRFITLSLILEHCSGILSTVLNTIAQSGGNIITINQGIPLSQAAHVTATVDVRQLVSSVEEWIETLESIPGVRKAEIVGYS